ncbi:MAG: lrp [Rhodospirillales bacterium]|nr:lrp [Rhodospirillales bacterium]
MKASGLDRIDIKILAALQADGRMTIQALSELVGLTARPCLERVRRLEKSGLIRRYAALLDLTAFDLVSVIAEIGLEHLHKQAQSKFEKRLAAEPAVVECWEVSGMYDYIARIVCPSLGAYQEMTNGWIEDPALGVARVVSNVVLREVRSFNGLPVPTARQKRLS